MATATTGEIYGELVDELTAFLRQSYRDDIGALAEAYPTRSHLRIDWGDLYRYDAEIAEDYLEQPDEVRDHLTEAIQEVPIPVPIDLEDVTVRMVGLHDTDIHRPPDIQKMKHPGYVGVTGDLAKATEPMKEIEDAAFECVRCMTVTTIRQTTEDLQEPYECQGCERKGPFEINQEKSTFTDYCKIRVQTPPDETGDIQHQSIDGFARGDLVWEGHDTLGLLARTGDNVTVYGTVERRATSADSRHFDSYLNVHAIEFDTDKDAVDIQAHESTFRDLAADPDPVSLIAESLAPDLYATPTWETALELLVAYLFGAPRIDIPGGTTFRGDIHVLIISDYGMGKSMVNEAVATYSPECIKESITGMSSEVGLLAAAVKDDFGDGQWTLEPGVLVRANGGHVILDEIDKSDVNLERMNDALEGEQIVTVNKAGQNATYKSRVGLLATGNPEDARFDPHVAIADQLDIDQSLLSRFDGIVTMSDHPDEDIDAKVAETQGLALIEAHEYEFGDREEFDVLDRPVTPEVGRAWIAYAREHVHPKPTVEHIEDIKRWYAEEVRPLNRDFAGEGEGADMPVPVTNRFVKAVLRFSMAFARVHLREEITETDVERAKDLAKSLVGQNFDGEKFHPQETRSTGPDTQQARVDFIIETLQEDGPINREDLLDIAEGAGYDRTKAGHAITGLKRDGEIYQPETGVLDTP